MKRRLIYLIAVAAAAGAIVSAPVSSASASVGPEERRDSPGAWDRCEEDEFCLFEDANGEGEMYSLAAPITIPYLGYFWNDRTSSIWNRSRYDVETFTAADLQGRGLSFTPYGAPVNLSLPHNDSISSLDVR
ncbi:peptidase inhibitor family I36 protein [Solicola gregarius]|uniref:peptidase inhibitor family I36 protein n=1 Tax=Solicola gregarius TaxID=2908642 RepID=UPI0038CD5551